MLNFVLDFLPWIVFSYLVHTVGPMYASGLLVVWIGVVSRKRLKKGFVLDWGGFIFFFLTLISTFSGSDMPKLYAHPSAWSNSALTAIMWISLIINKPFTLQYAKEVAPKEVHEALIFKTINQHMTLGWSLLMTLATLISLAHIYFDWHGMIASNISIILILIGAYMNQKYPDWYIGHHYRNKLKALPKVNTPFLEDNFAPIHKEIDCAELEVVGQIPNDLNGIYLRNGANPAFDPITYSFPFDGDGMVHAIYFKNGNAGYRNRYIQTKAYQNEKAVDKAIYPGVALPIAPDPKLLTVYPDEQRRNGAFIKVIYHANKFIAALEASAENYELDKDLNTLGVWDETGLKINAHARIDPANGEMIAVNYGFTNSINIVVFGKDGELSKEFNIDKENITVIHDFVITKNYIVILDCPAIINGNAFLQEEFNQLFQWQPELGSKAIVISRADGQLMTQVSIASFWVYHFANAYELDNKIIVEYMRAKSFELAEQENYYAYLDRMIIDLKTDQVERHKLSTNNCEFPRINEDYIGQKHQFIYMLDFDDDIISRRLIKYDNIANTSQVKDFGDDIELDEPQFVAKPDATSEDDGYILIYVYSCSKHTSSLFILDARNVEADPIAIIQIPQRVPHGLHGSWAS